MKAPLFPITFFWFSTVVTAYATGSESKLPRLSAALLCSSNSSTILDACLRDNITFTCEFGNDVNVNEGIHGLILANDRKIFEKWEYETRSFSATFNPTTDLIRHAGPITNFSCGTHDTPNSNVIRIRFHECLEQVRRTRRVLAGKTIKLICPWYQLGGRIEWDLDGFPLISNDKYRLNANANASLTISNLTTEDSGVYRCFFSPVPYHWGETRAMSYQLTVVSRDDIFPQRLRLVEINDTSLSFTSTIEMANRVGIKRLVNRTEPFVISYASLVDELVMNVTVHTQGSTVTILALAPSTLYAIQSIGITGRCFERQHNVQFFATLSPGERWSTVRWVRDNVRAAIDIDAEGEQKILYCNGNLEHLKNKNWNITWLLGDTRIISQPNGRRKIDPITGALVFDKVYTIDQSEYVCNIQYHGGSGLIKGDHVIEQRVSLMEAESRPYRTDGLTGAIFEFRCSNSTENSISISIERATLSESRAENGTRTAESSTPKSWLSFHYYELNGSGNEEAMDVMETNSTVQADRVVLEKLHADTLYAIWIWETNGIAERQIGLQKCWTDAIEDTFE